MPDYSLPTNSALPTPQGNILLYLPWQFDMLGGVDVVVDRLWKGLEKTIPGRTFIGIQDWHFQGEKTDVEGRRFLHINLPQPPNSGGSAIWGYRLTLARRLPILLRTLKAKQITTVNAHFPNRNVYGLALLKHYGLWNGRLVLSFHGSDVHDIDPTSPYWRLIARNTDAVTACSIALAKLVDGLGLFRTPTQVIYNGIDCQRFSKLAETAPLIPETKPPYILNVGNYVSHKGQDVLFKAFAQIAPDYPDLKLVCVGGTNNGIWLQLLKELAKTLQIESRVSLLENQAQSSVAALMQNANFFIHTSHREGFPLVLLEAAASFTPIIATRVGGIPEIIPSDQFGLLIDAGDVDGVIEMLRQLLKLPDKGKAMAISLQNRVENLFSVEKMVNDYLTALVKITG